MAHDIVIGGDAQPDSGHDIVIGTSGFGESLLEFTVPHVAIGTVMLIVFVRDSVVVPSDLTWTKVVDGVGAGALKLDAYVRTADKTPGSRNGDVISFLSLVPQELQGSLVVLDEAIASTVFEAIDHGAFTADASPAAPPINAEQAQDTILCLWSAEGTIAFDPPVGFTELEAYTSAVVSARTLMVARRTADAAGEFDPGNAASSPASTGRVFTLALRYTRLTRKSILNARASDSIGAYYDQMIDPVTLDYIDTEDGEFAETADSRSLVLCMIEMRLGEDFFAPGDGTRVKALLESDDGEPITDEIALAETLRAMEILTQDGIVADVSANATHDLDGRMVITVQWRDLASGSPVDLVYIPFGQAA